MNDDLTLTAGGRTIGGWTEVRVTRGIERCPSDFELGLTERFPGEASTVVVQPGDACSVQLGNDLVVTGYVDRVQYELSAGRHAIRVTGRGKCADLLDCSAVWPGYQISGADALGIAQKLAQPYGITVSASGSTGVRVQQFNLMPGETAFEIIERVCRFGALLAYDQPDGSLLLAQAAQAKAASGFTQGVNVESARMLFGMDQRYSLYQCINQSMTVLADAGDGGDLLATATDAGVPRYRNRVIINEAPSGGLDFAQKRVQWEANRRLGRSAQLFLVTDGWRDASGALWAQNTLVPLVLPLLKCGTADAPFNWLIAEVTYRRDLQGTHAELILMRPEAFQPMPVVQLLSGYADVTPNAGLPTSAPEALGP